MRMFHRNDSKPERSRFYLVTVHIVFGLFFAATLALVFGYVVMLLWNSLIPDILALPPVTYWQSVGLLLLARILVGGFGHGKGRHSRHERREGPQAWKEYDEWWKEVGERSFRQYSSDDSAKSSK
ncbi:MAG: hypothetical protein ACLGSA_13825 [Acidobacteriota bacterium]